jgi:hypothetical protein
MAKKLKKIKKKIKINCFLKKIKIKIKNFPTNPKSGGIPAIDINKTIRDVVIKV